MTPEQSDEACAREAWETKQGAHVPLSEFPITRQALIMSARLSREREAARHNPPVDQDVLDLKRLLIAFKAFGGERDPDFPETLATFRTIKAERGWK